MAETSCATYCVSVIFDNSTFRSFGKFCPDERVLYNCLFMWTGRVWEKGFDLERDLIRRVSRTGSCRRR